MPLVSPFHKTLCPICFHRFHISEAPTRVMSPSGETQPDQRVGDFFGIPAPELPPVEEPEQNWKRRFYLPVHRDTADRVIRRRICPWCGLSLPNEQGNGRRGGQVVAIVGGRGTGKSNFIAMLIRMLERRYSTEAGFSIWPQETFSVDDLRRVSSEDLYQRRYGSLFNESNRSAIGQTPSAGQNRDIRTPLIYRLTFRMRPQDRLLNPLADVRCVDLVLFDAAGEDMEDLTATEQYWRYAMHASGVIFLLDPCGYPEVRNQLPAQMRERLARDDAASGAGAGNGTPSKPHMAVQGILNGGETLQLRQGNRQVKVPCAFVLTKSDLLENVSALRRSLFHRRDRHEGGFNLPDSEQIDAELRQWLCSFGDGGTVVNLADVQFARNRFFAVSALGQLPEENLSISDPSPRRIADPLLWILMEMGFLPPMPQPDLPQADKEGAGS